MYIGVDSEVAPTVARWMNFSTWTQEDYESARTEIEAVASAEARTIEGRRRAVLTTLARAYEARIYPFGLLSPEAVARYRLENGWTEEKAGDLPPPEPTLVMLVDGNRTYEDIARITDLPVEHVRMRLGRARRKLRQP